MCGIVGVLSANNNCIDILLNGLTQLQNRGYDSAGVATIKKGNGVQVNVNKYASTDKTNALVKIYSNRSKHEDSHIGIGHTRWATHGAKTDENSHPHVSSDEKFVIVHNGIIENYEELKGDLKDKCYIFHSQTDSEVIANLLAYMYTKCGNVEESIKQTILLLEGTWALCILCIDTPDILYCTRNGSPLLVGQTEEHIIVTSEQSGFTEEVDDYIVLKNMDICTIKNNSINTSHNYNRKKVLNKEKCLTPEPYPYWTIKEIHEQSDSLLRVINFGGRIQSNCEVKLGGLDTMKEELLELENLILLGCGTSYNAGLLGSFYFKDICNFNIVQVIDGAEFTSHDIPKLGKTGLILLSQSGETKDLHRCIKIAKENGLITIGVVNVPDSLIAREVDCGCYLNAGKEVAVASTKSFTSQCVLLSLIAIWFAQNKHISLEKRRQYICDLHKLNEQIKQVLDLKINKMVKIFIDKKNCFVLGKGIMEAISKEASLKIKEISYIHSESYSTSSLKHGPFALLEEGFPVILFCPNDEHLTKNVNAFHEIKSRHAVVVLVSNTEVVSKNCVNIIVPENKTYNGILSIIPLQMLAYELSVGKGFNPDMPKNLAKVVTVE
jgi:glutamine---fructose-6-phosphate transaminase (isomerizing)